MSSLQGIELARHPASDAPYIFSTNFVCPVNKPKLREKYGILDEWVLPYKVRGAQHTSSLLRELGF